MTEPSISLFHTPVFLVKKKDNKVLHWFQGSELCYQTWHQADSGSWTMVPKKVHSGHHKVSFNFKRCHLPVLFEWTMKKVKLEESMVGFLFLWHTLFNPNLGWKYSCWQGSNQVGGSWLHSVSQKSQSGIWRHKVLRACQMERMMKPVQNKVSKIYILTIPSSKKEVWLLIGQQILQTSQTLHTSLLHCWR